ncbi:hypothetical protein GA398_14970 [Bacteroides xylanisolvens]|jgi:hypothetical protein|uniref:Uncharacterized protein n=1 Tax=Bacteroides xylanisolvens TaxID=371601 RepID=A0A7J5PUR9_9BACE|nr:hypothetical protein GA398_14970 [Bacteroides xylanisolvens]
MITNLSIFLDGCKEIHYTCNKKRYFAIAFSNIVGGYEICNPYFKGCIAIHCAKNGEIRRLLSV